mgnify:CR=1 FL=1
MSFILSIAGVGLSMLAFMITFVYFCLLYTITKYTDSQFIGVGKICIAALPILTIIATIIDPPATMLNVVGDTVSSMMVTRVVDGKDWIENKD